MTREPTAPAFSIATSTLWESPRSPSREGLNPKHVVVERGISRTEGCHRLEAIYKGIRLTDNKRSL